MIKKISKYFEKYIIPLKDINIHKDGLRKESFEFLDKFFTTKEWPLELGKVILSQYPDSPKKVVEDGRHRLLLAIKHGIKEIPAIFKTYDNLGNIIEIKDVLIYD